MPSMLWVFQNSRTPVTDPRLRSSVSVNAEVTGAADIAARLSGLCGKMPGAASERTTTVTDDAWPRRRDADRHPRARRLGRRAQPRALVGAGARAGRRLRRARRGGRAAPRVLRGRADRVRPAARSRRHRLPATVLARARHDPVPPDRELRRAGAP